MEASVIMYTTPDWFQKYKDGKIAWGVSEEGRTYYPYMRMQVSVHASEVISIEEKTQPHPADYNKTVQYLSYDIRRRKHHGD